MGRRVCDCRPLPRVRLSSARNAPSHTRVATAAGSGGFGSSSVGTPGSLSTSGSPLSLPSSILDDTDMVLSRGLGGGSGAHPNLSTHVSRLPSPARAVTPHAGPQDSKVGHSGYHTRSPRSGAGCGARAYCRQSREAIRDLPGLWCLQRRRAEANPEGGHEGRLQQTPVHQQVHDGLPPPQLPRCSGVQGALADVPA